MRIASPLTCLLCFLPLAGLTGQTSSPRLGSIDFPTSAGPGAQRAFEEGVLWMHSFEYPKAAAAFRRAQEIEPGFALAYWGEAMTHNHPVWNQRDAAAARAVLARLAPTPEARAAMAATKRERAWLATAEVLWGDGPKAVRDTLYERAMAELARDYSDDESATFHALAILGLRQAVRHIPDYMRAGAIALEVFQRSPNHPGAAHYVIHAFDDPDHASLGLGAATAYSVIAPDAGHAQHMTTHIFLALGMWDQVARQNVVAMQAATGNSDSLDWRPGHYTWWLNYARLQQGKWSDSRRWLRRQFEIIPPDAPLMQRRFLQRMQDESSINWARFDQIIDSRRPDAMTGPITLLTQGLANWQTGHTALLAREADALDALLEANPHDTVTAILAPQLRALLLAQTGQRDSAFAVLRRAVEYEASLPMDFGPPLAARPAHEAYAELLLEFGNAADAQRAFSAALERTPGRSRTLAGLVLAAEKSGDSAAAAAARGTLEANFHDADPGALQALFDSFGRP